MTAVTFTRSKRVEKEHGCDDGECVGEERGRRGGAEGVCVVGR